MTFKNVCLAAAARKWADYFVEKYPEYKISLGQSVGWTDMTVNHDHTIFVKKDRENREEDEDIDLFYFWHGQLFAIKMRQIWRGSELQAWDCLRLMAYPVLNYARDRHLPEALKTCEEHIFQDLKSALMIYGEVDREVITRPLPNIQIRVGGKLY